VGVGRLDSEVRRVSEGLAQDRRRDLNRLAESVRRVMAGKSEGYRGRPLARGEVIVRPLEQSRDSDGQASDHGLTGHEQNGRFRMQSQRLNGPAVG
jgi:hypothetical protein